jgi:signal transduction histidine kinase
MSSFLPPNARASHPRALAWFLLALVAIALPVSNGSHGSPLHVAPQTASSTTWSSPSAAVDGNPDSYASVSSSGAVISLTGFATTQRSGTISQVRFEVEATQAVRIDDRLQLKLLGGCADGVLNPDQIQTGGSGSSVTVDVQCPQGITFQQVATMGLELRTSSGLLTDSEYRLHEVRLRLSFTNGAPTARAPNDFETAESVTVPLDGSPSSDPDNDALTYQWAQVAGDSVAVQGADQPKASFVAPTLNTNVDRILRFRLTVNDGQGHSNVDEVAVTVKNQNQPPVARAGPSQSAAPGDLVSLDGSASFDPDQDAISYQWTQIQGTAVTLSDPAKANPTFMAPAASTDVVLRLRVKDALGVWSSPDEVSVFVRSASPTPAPTPPSTTPPTTSSTPPPTPSGSPTPTATLPSSTTPSTTPSATRSSSPTPPLPGHTAEPVTDGAPPTIVESIGGTTQPCMVSLEFDIAEPAAIAYPTSCPLRLLVVQFPSTTLGPIAITAAAHAEPVDGLPTPPSGPRWGAWVTLAATDRDGHPVESDWARIYIPTNPEWLESICGTDCEAHATHLEGAAWRTVNVGFDNAFPPNQTWRVEAATLGWFAVGVAPAAQEAATPLALLWPWGLLALLPVLGAGFGVGRALRRRPKPAALAMAAPVAPAQEPAASGTDERVSRLLREMRTNRDLLQFVNNAAHDLANPLTPINLQLHVLQKAAEDRQDQQQQKSLAMVRRNVEQLGLLVQDLKDAARLQAGKLRMTPEPLDLAQIVRETAEGYEEKAKVEGIALEVATEPGLDVKADSGRIVQVLTNFLTNALKFTPKGGRVRVSAGREDGAAIVLVEDSGLGLTPEDRDRLFKAFSQVHDEKQKKKGTGLGLYIAKGIIEAHGGHIGCDSEGPGRGSTFWFSLPLSGAATATPDTAPAPMVSEMGSP